MAGKKGRSGRKSWIAEVRVEEVCKLSVQVLKKFLKEEGIPLAEKAKVASEITKKYMPMKVKGEGFGIDIYNIINQLQRSIEQNPDASLELDTGTGLYKRRARLAEPNKEVSQLGTSENNL